MAGDAGELAPKRQDAIKLAKGSKWDELRRLVDAEPAAAQQVDSYGMLPLHWACTEPQAVGEGVLLALLKAFPQGARAANTADMLPLHIAIKAQARIEWLQALLASFPDAVLRKAPTGEHAVALARKAVLPDRSVKLLEEMYHHVCDKLGVPDELEEEDAMAAAMVGGPSPSPPPPAALSNAVAAAAAGVAIPQRRSGGLQQQLSMATASPAPASGPMRRASSTDSMRLRTLSDNDFFQTHYMSSAGSSISSSAGKLSADTTATSSSSISSFRPLQQQQQPQGAVAGRGGAVALPPRWMNAPNCHICAQKFGAFKKRHHCRNCGQSICSDHSAREKMKLPHYGLGDRHRVCTVCHDLLRNARRQQQHQEFQQQIPAPPPSTSQIQQQPLPMRRSDEAQRSPMQQQQQLERHVSAPARHNMGDASATGGDSYRVMHDQVALLQQQVSRLMEEKQEAERQLRVQAEMLEEALDPERLTNMSNGRGTDVRSSSSSGGGGQQQRDRLNSYPLRLPSATTSAGVSTSEEQQQQFFQQQQQQLQHTSSMSSLRGSAGVVYQSTGQAVGRGSNRSIPSNGSFRRAPDVDIDSPLTMAAPAFQSRAQAAQAAQAAQTTPAFAAHNSFTSLTGKTTTTSPSRPLEDAFTNISFVESNYEDSDVDSDDNDVAAHQQLRRRQQQQQQEQRQVPRPTDLSEFHDAEADAEAESADEYVVDDEVDDDEDEDEDEQRPEVNVLVHLGHTMMDKGSYSAAAQAFARAAEICPTDGRLHALLGRAYYADESLEEAVAALTRSLDLEPSATNSTLLGKILFEKGDHEKAIEAYQRSLDMQK